MLRGRPPAPAASSRRRRPSATMTKPTGRAAAPSIPPTAGRRTPRLTTALPPPTDDPGDTARTPCRPHARQTPPDDPRNPGSTPRCGPIWQPSPCERGSSTAGVATSGRPCERGSSTAGVATSPRPWAPGSRACPRRTAPHPSLIANFPPQAGSPTAPPGRPRRGGDPPVASRAATSTRIAWRHPTPVCHQPPDTDPPAALGPCGRHPNDCIRRTGLPGSWRGVRSGGGGDDVTDAKPGRVERQDADVADLSVRRSDLPSGGWRDTAAVRRDPTIPAGVASPRTPRWLDGSGPPNREGDTRERSWWCRHRHTRHAEGSRRDAALHLLLVRAFPPTQTCSPRCGVAARDGVRRTTLGHGPITDGRQGGLNRANVSGCRAPRSLTRGEGTTSPALRLLRCRGRISRPPRADCTDRSAYPMARRSASVSLRWPGLSARVGPSHR